MSTENMTIRQMFGEHAAMLRRKSRLSQERVAEVLGLHQTQVSKMERGARPILIEETVPLAGLYGVTPRDMWPSAASNPWPAPAYADGYRRGYEDGVAAARRALSRINPAVTP